MTPGELYEKCVALGLCERALWNHCHIYFDIAWIDESERPVPADEANDLACMTVLRALKKIGLLGDPGYMPCDVTDLESLCLCLLRASGHETTPSPTP